MSLMPVFSYSTSNSYGVGLVSVTLHDCLRIDLVSTAKYKPAHHFLHDFQEDESLLLQHVPSPLSADDC